MQFALILCVLAGYVGSHSWVEQVVRIAPNGTLVGPVGYMRGYVSRTAPGFVDAANMHLLPHEQSEGNVVHNDDRMCGTAQGNYSDEYPMLLAAPGDLIALRYQENGHVTLPENSPPKPGNRGTIYVYGTGDPSNDDRFWDIHGVWTTSDEPTNGRRGSLIAIRNFDDGQCYQINDGPISAGRQAMVNKEARDPQGADLWCQVDLRIPSDLEPSGIYTLYWVWDWPTILHSPRDSSSGAAQVMSQEIYTSCVDIQLIRDGISNHQKPAFIYNQDPNSRAIREQIESTSLLAC